MGNCLRSGIKAEKPLHTGRNGSEGGILQSSNLKSFSFSELKNATRNFRPDGALGEGGFGSVYKGWIDEQGLTATKPGMGIVIAVQLFAQERYQHSNRWLAEVKYLGQLYHPNLVRLLGYCIEDDHWFLVYEFMPRGSLDNHLFRRDSKIQPLSWRLRMKVALGAAKVLAFVDSLDENNVIYEVFTCSNILLDSNYNAKLCGFVLPKDGQPGDDCYPGADITMGTSGYAAPEYIATEMLSGRRAIDRNQPLGKYSLVKWAKPYLNHEQRILDVLDSRLEGRYSLKGSRKAARLALQCLSMEAKFRPNMDEVVKSLEGLQDSKGK